MSSRGLKRRSHCTVDMAAGLSWAKIEIRWSVDTASGASWTIDKADDLPWVNRELPWAEQLVSCHGLWNRMMASQGLGKRLINSHCMWKLLVSSQGLWTPALDSQVLRKLHTSPRLVLLFGLVFVKALRSQTAHSPTKVSTRYGCHLILISLNQHLLLGFVYCPLTTLEIIT